MSNIGIHERLARAAIAFALLYWAMTPLGPTLAAGYGGLFLLATAIVGWCPWYKSFGSKTAKQQ
ncbi:hypothetical protein Tbd_1498 [Thiobacillus denitrificans ATCC 25259]|uniref:Inner membrane protein YgaP-like transmembrane domain-containing protein n=1 Tax=Thiobacillus denitrificans (strain ATCC 25259 / T1) TaxID=292415 RepID=Q3SIS4_THIDA|nr:DUF2892 domain-containing protein [Thiobacillus denitrificans]AAZ97451.1 hypothetical protein Tbd_1498 [Thiobacillus denitrificans ATCC 25259]